MHTILNSSVLFIAEFPLQVPASAFTDAAGLTNIEKTISAPVDAIQGQPEVASITGLPSAGSMAPDEAIALTFTTSEPTSDFAPGDIVTTPSSCGSFAVSWTSEASAGAGTAYVVQYTAGSASSPCEIKVLRDESTLIYLSTTVDSEY